MVHIRFFKTTVWDLILVENLCLSAVCTNTNFFNTKMLDPATVWKLAFGHNFFLTTFQATWEHQHLIFNETPMGHRVFYRMPLVYFSIKGFTRSQMSRKCLFAAMCRNVTSRMFWKVSNGSTEISDSGTLCTYC